MENQLNLAFMLTLKEISLRRMAINLWIEPDILALVEKFRSDSDYSEKWRKTVERKVTSKLSKLAIPKSFAKLLLHILTPIGLQIKRWKVFHEHYLMAGCEEFLKEYIVDSLMKFDAPILSKLCWTSSGIVDYIKTAEELVRCKMLDILVRYQLACLYCLENCIPLLWEELSEENKKTFYNEKCTSQVQGLNLQFCWPYILKGEQSKLDCLIKRNDESKKSFNRAVFEFSVRRGNKAASEYFFQKLTYEEKKDSLKITAAFVILVRSYARLNYSAGENISNVLFYLLSLMDPEEQMTFFKLHPVELLVLFLDWPWHDLFLQIANLTWTFLPLQDYDHLLKKLNDYFREQKYYFPFLKMFQEFFISSPASFRKRFIDRECRLGDFFPLLFDIQDSETVKIIFRNVDPADRVRLVSCKHVLKLFYNYILNRKCEEVKLCLREATLSNEDKERLIEVFLTSRITDRRKTKTCNLVRNKFLKLLDDIYGNAQSKRSSEDEALNKAKKLCADE